MNVHNCRKRCIIGLKITEEEREMPTPWKRSPEELHKTYLANTDAFYRVAGRGLPRSWTSLSRPAPLGLWRGSAG